VRDVALLADRMTARAVLLDQHFAFSMRVLSAAYAGAVGLRSTTPPKSPALGAPSPLLMTFDD